MKPPKEIKPHPVAIGLFFVAVALLVSGWIAAIYTPLESRLPHALSYIGVGVMVLCLLILIFQKS
jgi:hypothetical protein